MNSTALGSEAYLATFALRGSEVYEKLPTFMAFSQVGLIGKPAAECKYITSASMMGTVWMNEMPRFYVGKLLLHHYKSDLAHTSDRYSSMTELHLSEV